MDHDNNSNLKLITAEEFANMLAISQRTLRRLVSEGKVLPAIRIGKSVRWIRRDVLAWVEQGCPSRKSSNSMK